MERAGLGAGSPAGPGSMRLCSRLPGGPLSVVGFSDKYYPPLPPPPPTDSVTDHLIYLRYLLVQIGLDTAKIVSVILLTVCCQKGQWGGGGLNGAKKGTKGDSKVKEKKWKKK